MTVMSSKQSNIRRRNKDMTFFGLWCLVYLLLAVSMVTIFDDKVFVSVCVGSFCVDIGHMDGNRVMVSSSRTNKLFFLLIITTRKKGTQFMTQPVVDCDDVGRC